MSDLHDSLRERLQEAINEGLCTYLKRDYIDSRNAALDASRKVAEAVYDLLVSEVAAAKEATRDAAVELIETVITTEPPSSPYAEGFLDGRNLAASEVENMDLGAVVATTAETT